MMTRAEYYRPAILPFFISLLFTVLCFFSCAQTPAQPEIPTLISSRFKAMYPEAKDIQWSLAGTAFQVSFTFRKTAFIMLFLEDGGVEWTKTKSDLAAMPEGITHYASTNLRGQTISEAWRVINGFGIVTWEVKAGTKKYLFNEQGQFLGMLP
jgi:hypothetical protein